MIPSCCLHSLKPGDIIILNYNIKEPYRFRQLRKWATIRDQQKYGYEIEVVRLGILYNFYEKVNNITKIIKHK